ncbi:MAG TPA: IS982 family transposase, partial [Amycolatopsis sp.]|nr:IS982 family transposase [Amycolatopsis sp.]
PKLDERQVLMAILDHDPSLLTDRPGLLIIGDKGYISRELDSFLTERVLALTAAIWHNRATGQPVTRSLIAYDH